MGVPHDGHHLGTSRFRDFTDAKILGVRPGDIFFFVQEATSVPSSQMLRLNVVSQ